MTWCDSHVRTSVGWVVSLYLCVRVFLGPQVRDVEVSIDSTLFLYAYVSAHETIAFTLRAST